MKPGSRDKKVKVLITGQELEELQKHIWLMAESFGLDRRIDSYQGTRPIGLYSWDLECLLEVLETVLDNSDDYPTRGSPEYDITAGLYRRLKHLFDATF